MLDSLRLFEADVGLFAPISDRCEDSLRLFETDVGRGCAYLRQIWGQFAPI